MVYTFNPDGSRQVRKLTQFAIRVPRGMEVMELIFEAREINEPDAQRFNCAVDLDQAETIARDILESVTRIRGQNSPEA